MNQSQTRALFSALLVVEGLGCQFLFWSALPFYRRLHEGGEGVSGTELVLALSAATVMQASHWAAFRLRQRLRFGRMVLVGYVLVWLGELSLFFVAALAAVIIFDRARIVDVYLWKLATLGAVLFAATSFKRQLMSLGEELITAPAGERG